MVSVLSHYDHCLQLILIFLKVVKWESSIITGNNSLQTSRVYIMADREWEANVPGSHEVIICSCNLTKYISLSWSKEKRHHHAPECLPESRGHIRLDVILINEEQVAWQGRRALISQGWLRCRLAWSRDGLWWLSKFHSGHNITFLASIARGFILPSRFIQNEPVNKLFKVTSIFQVGWTSTALWISLQFA